MIDSILKNRRNKRQRMDKTAIHFSNETNVLGKPEIVKLDIVAKKISIFIPTDLEVDIRGSEDGKNFFDISLAITGPAYISYGNSAGEHLVKLVSIDRIGDPSSGSLIIVGV